MPKIMTCSVGSLTQNCCKVKTDLSDLPSLALTLALKKHIDTLAELWKAREQRSETGEKMEPLTGIEPVTC
jgi:hypothetical protein